MLRALPVEVVASQLLVAGTPLHHVVGDPEDAVADRHQRPLLSLRPDQPPVLRRQVRLPGMRGGPRLLNQRVPEVRAPFVRLPRQPLPRALVVARTHPGPTRQVRAEGKRLMSTPISEASASATRARTRDGLQQLHGLSDERVAALAHLHLYTPVDPEGSRSDLIQPME